MAISNAVSLANFSSKDILIVDSTNDRVGIASTTPTEALTVVGVVSATSFFGSGADLTGIVAGATLNASSGTQRLVVTSQTSGSMTQAATNADITYATSTNTLSATTFSGAFSGNVTGNVSGTAGGLTGIPSIIVQDITAETVSIAGTISYEDVTNVNSVGIITANKGIRVPNYGITVTGVVTATTFNSTSDIKLKNNVTTVVNALEVVNQLRGVRFDWKESGVGDYGVIAQELEEVLPELVSQGDPKTVNYNGIIGVLIESIKELSEKVKSLEDK